MNEDNTYDEMGNLTEKSTHINQLEMIERERLQSFFDNFTSFFIRMTFVLAGRSIGQPNEASLTVGSAMTSYHEPFRQHVDLSFPKKQPTVCRLIPSAKLIILHKR